MTEFHRFSLCPGFDRRRPEAILMATLMVLTVLFASPSVFGGETSPCLEKISSGPYFGAVDSMFAPSSGEAQLGLTTLLTFPLLYGGSGIQLLGNTLSEEQAAYFDNVVRWMKYSMISLGVNTGALVLSFIAPTAGGIVGILSLGAWGLCNMYMALSYRDLTDDLNAVGSDLPRPTVPGYAALGAAAFASGAMAAISLSFSDTTGVARVLAYICTAISGGSGIVAILKTYRYAEEVEYTIRKGG